MTHLPEVSGENVNIVSPSTRISPPSVGITATSGTVGVGVSTSGVSVVSVGEGLGLGDGLGVAISIMSSSSSIGEADGLGVVLSVHGKMSVKIHNAPTASISTMTTATIGIQIFDFPFFPPVLSCDGGGVGALYGAEPYGGGLYGGAFSGGVPYGAAP